MKADKTMFTRALGQMAPPPSLRYRRRHDSALEKTLNQFQLVKACRQLLVSREAKTFVSGDVAVCLSLILSSRRGVLLFSNVEKTRMQVDTVSSCPKVLTCLYITL